MRWLFRYEGYSKEWGVSQEKRKLAVETPRAGDTDRKFSLPDEDAHISLRGNRQGGIPGMPPK